MDCISALENILGIWHFKLVNLEAISIYGIEVRRFLKRVFNIDAALLLISVASHSRHHVANDSR